MILAAAFRVHSRLGPGLSESVYQQVLAYELTKGGLSVEVQKSIPIFYDELFFDDGYRAVLGWWAQREKTGETKRVHQNPSHCSLHYELPTSEFRLNPYFAYPSVPLREASVEEKGDRSISRSCSIFALHLSPATRRSVRARLGASREPRRLR